MKRLFIVLIAVSSFGFYSCIEDQGEEPAIEQSLPVDENSEDKDLEEDKD